MKLKSFFAYCIFTLLIFSLELTAQTTGNKTPKAITLTAGANINITNNNGNYTISATNQRTCNLNFAVQGSNLAIMDSCGTRLVPLADINAIDAVLAGTCISIINNNGQVKITNTCPDQTVTITGGSGVTVTGNYPNFTLAAADVSPTNECNSGLFIRNDSLLLSDPCGEYGVALDNISVTPDDLCTQIQNLPTGTATATDKIVYFGGGTVPSNYVGYDFDNAVDFACSGGDPTLTGLWDMQFSGGNAALPSAIALTDTQAINNYINTIVIPAYNLINSPPLAVGDIVYQYNSGDNTVTVWYNPAITLYPTNFVIGDILSACEKPVPTIPTTHTTSIGCFLGDAASSQKVANGLNVSNDTIKLGGALIENTIIVGGMDKNMILTISDTVTTINKVHLSNAGVQLKSEGVPSTSEVNLNVGELLLRGETAFKIVTPNTTASLNGSVLRLIDNTTGESDWGAETNFLNTNLTATGDRVHDGNGYDWRWINAKNINIQNGGDFTFDTDDFFNINTSAIQSSSSTGYNLFTSIPGTPQIWNNTYTNNVVAGYSVHHTPSNKFAFFGASAANVGVIASDNSQFVFATTTTGISSPTNLTGTTTKGNFSTTGFNIGGGGAATSTLDVTGSFSLPVLVVNSSTTLTDNNCSIQCNNGGTAITITLPSALTSRGRIYILYRGAGSSGIVTISAIAGQVQDLNNSLATNATLNGGASGQRAWFQSDGTNWMRLN